MKKLMAIFMALILTAGMAACASPAPAATTAPAPAAPAADAPAAAEPAAAPAPAGDGEIVIAVSWQDLKNEYIKSLADVFEAYCTELGIKYISNDGAGSAETQISQVETFITQKVDAIILNPYDSDGCVPAAAKAKEAGIPIILVCTVLSDMSNVTSFVGSNDENAGIMEAELILKTIGDTGTVVILRGPNGHSAEINRSKGIFSVLDKNPNIKVAFDQTANWDRAEAMGLLENWIQTGTQIDAVISENDEMAIGAYNALVAAGKPETPVVGVDGIADAYRSISEGGMLATFLQDNVAQSKTAVDVALKAAKGETVETLYDIPFTLVNKDNVSEFMK